MLKGICKEIEGNGTPQLQVPTNYIKCKWISCSPKIPTSSWEVRCKVC